MPREPDASVTSAESVSSVILTVAAHPFTFVILSAATALRHSHKERPREGPL